MCLPRATQGGWGEEAEGSGRGAPRHHTPPAFEAAAPQPKQKVKVKQKEENKESIDMPQIKDIFEKEIIMN